MTKYHFDLETNEEETFNPWGPYVPHIEEQATEDLEEKKQVSPHQKTTIELPPDYSSIPKQTEKQTNPFAVNIPTSPPSEPLAIESEKEPSAPKLHSKSDTQKEKTKSVSKSTDSQTKKYSEKKPSQQSLLASIVQSQELYLNQDKIPYVTIRNGLSTKDIEVNSSYYSEHLTLKCFKDHGVVPTDVKNAVKLSNAIAVTNETIHPVYTRFHFDGKKLVLDLCDGMNRIVVADKNGWKVTQKGNYKFNQPDYMQPLPTPDENGNICDLLDFFDFHNPLDKNLAAIWVVTALASEIDRPILLIQGPQGAGKTTIADIIRSTIDPVSLTGMGMPKTEKDFAVQLHRHQIPSFDNLSVISGPIQDLMCRIVTGGSIERRKLYTDMDSVFISFKRAMILTAIKNPITQGDLLDRTLSLRLRRFDDTERKLKADIPKQFKKKHASILGGVLNTFVGALNVLDTLNLDRLPRLADFFRFGTAVAEHIGESRGFGQAKFTRAMTCSMRQSYQYGADDDPLTFTLIDFLREQSTSLGQDKYTFKGKELFDKLLKHASGIDIDPNELPKAPSSLSRALKKISQALEHQGWDMEFSASARTAREITFSIRCGL